MSPNIDWQTSPIWVTPNQHVDVVHSPDVGLPNVVFLHGYGLSPQSYKEALNYMALWGRVIAPTLPGFGSSTALPRDRQQELSSYATSVAAAWESFDAPYPLPIVGHSMGCGVAVRLARNRPEMVSSLTLVCPIGGAGSHPVTWIRLAGSLMREAHVSWGPRLWDSGPTLLANPGRALRAAVTAKNANLVNDLHFLVNSGLPVTIIAAHGDGVVPPGPLRHVGAHFIEVDGGHGWLLRRPAEFADLVKQPVLNPLPNP